MPQKKKTTEHNKLISSIELFHLVLWSLAVLGFSYYFFQMIETERLEHKVLVAQMDDEIKTLKEKLATKPEKEIVEKIVEVPKVVEKVIIKKVPSENSGKIRELRKIIVNKNIELDQCRR